MGSQKPNGRITAADFLPSSLNLTSLRQAAANCQGCDLYKNATQTVFGEGPRRAQLMLIGEVPGDQEDRQGRPFVGPAGRLLDQSLESAELARSDVYMTNAVKHFKFKQRGKRRMHDKPKRIEVVSCRAWLEAEIEVVKPGLLVCLGATAAQALLGSQFRITRHRGQIIRGDEWPAVLPTWHPSAVLRAPQDSDRERMRGELVEDLIAARQFLASKAG